MDLVAPPATIQEITPNVRSEPVTALDVTFSEPINPTTFTVSDLILRRDDQVAALGGVSITSKTSLKSRSVPLS